MTEAEWLVCLDAKRMLEFAKTRASARKQGFLIGGCFRPQALTDPRMADALRSIKRYLEGQCDPEQHGHFEFIRLKSLLSTVPQAAHIARDVFGNPFRLMPAIPVSWLAWNDRAVRKIAQVIYDERRFTYVPLLADALEEAGCADADILAHCRGPGPHVRGCWVVDLLLGKA